MSCSCTEPTVLQMSRNTVLVLGSLTAAKRMHSGLLTNILKLPMSFHDSTPTGRLLNRFARDTEAGTTGHCIGTKGFHMM